MVIVDSTVWIDYFAKRDTPETIWLSEAISYRRLGLEQYSLRYTHPSIRLCILDFSGEVTATQLHGTSVE